MCHLQALRVVVLGAVLLSGVNSVAKAATFAIDFDGTVESVTDGVRGGSLDVGAPVHGHIVIERNGLVDLYPDDPANGIYGVSAPFPVLSFDLSIGDYVASAGVPNANNGLTVYDGFLFPPVDLFAAAANLVGAPVNGLVPHAAIFALFSYVDLSRIQGDDVPTLAELNAWQGDLPFSDGDVNTLTFGTGEADVSDRIDWQIDRYSVVPEPSLLLLALLALAGLTGSAARSVARDPTGS